MHRRDFVRALVFAALAGQLPNLHAGTQANTQEPIQDEGLDRVKDHLYRVRKPDHHYQADIRANELDRQLLISTTARLKRVQRIIGYGNFNVVGFDEILLYSRRYSKIGRFQKNELKLLEQLFYEDASQYGFLGSKPMTSLTQNIRRREIVKIPGSGHYLFKGKPLTNYQNIRQQLGDEVVLTSGIRGIVKQIHLFLAKATKYQGNLSLASRSLAPPGYSFHGTGDFDVGIAGWGYRNFTEEFATTDVFRRLMDLGYFDIRYPLDNRLGVRFEPWHIKVS